MDKASLHPRISMRSAIMAGKPCIRDTRITVEIILRYLAGGASFETIEEAFPALETEDIVAAIEFAAAAIPAPTVAAE